MTQLNALGIKNIGTSYWLASRGKATNDALGVWFFNGSTNVVCGSGFYNHSGASLAMANGTM